MASFLDKMNVKTALSNYSHHDLSCDHITTANFMQFNCAYSRELVPKQKIKLDMETFARLQPLPVPTFGRCRIQNRAFFVPFRTIFPAWQDFITNARHTWSDGTNTIPESTPIIKSSVLTDFLLDGLIRYTENGMSQSMSVADQVTDPSEGNFDMYTPDGIALKFTSIGRWVYKLFCSLRMNFLLDYADVDSRVEASNLSYSALPLLSLAKVYADWYYPSQYASSPEFARVESLFNMDSPSYSLTVEDLEVIFSFMKRVNYDSDYFTSAWQNPVAPNTDSYSNLSVVDSTSSFSYQDSRLPRPIYGIRNEVTTGNDEQNGTPVIQNQFPVSYDPDNSSTPFLRSLSQFAIDTLKAMTDYMKRHQLVGGRALDRYLARFGVKLSDEMLRRSVYIGSAEDNMRFGDVISTSDTEGSVLGNYAGKGIGYCDGSFTFENGKDYGMLIVVSTIVPKTGYYQGIDRNVMHVTRLDFWTPEFDNLGVQAISKAELFTNNTLNPSTLKVNTSPGVLWNSVFGFTPRYAEYKISHDMLSGDFRCNSVNAGMDSWHTLRTIVPSTFDRLVVSPTFVSGDDAGQYSRIFYNTDDSFDKFNVIHSFRISSDTPMKSLFNTYEFRDKGDEIQMQPNGVKLN